MKTHRVGVDMIIIRKDTVWGPGVKTLTDDIQIAQGATLTILPGTQIEGQFHSIEAYGSLKAIGSKENPILFSETYIGTSNSYGVDGKIDIKYAHIDGGSLNGYSVGSHGDFNVDSSTITNIIEPTYLFSNHGASQFTNNVFMNTTGFYAGYGNDVFLGYNVFDSTYYNGLYAILSVSGGYNQDARSVNNAYLSVGTPTLELRFSDSNITSLRDYFGTTNLNGISKMIIDNNDDLEIENEIDITSHLNSPSSFSTKYMFGFKTISLPRDVVVEARLFGTSNADLTGNKLKNILTGNAGKNVIDGGLGADMMAGKSGDDTYIVDNVGDIVIENSASGYDRVISSVSYTLADNVDMLTLSGAKAINATGNSLANHLVGNSAANVLDGKGGIDLMEGGAGNDIYYVDHVSDRVSEMAGNGRDAVISTVSYKLAAGQEIEVLQAADLNSAAALNFTGNGLGNKLVGNAGKNVLEGAGGNDILTGGKGADTFVFATKIGAGNLDHITDFSAVDDLIQLSKSIFTALAPGQLTAAEFKDIAKAKVDADDHILYDSRNGSLFYDADGSGKAAAVKFAVLDNKAAITHADFLIA